MTCIAAFADKQGIVWMCGDAATCAGQIQYSHLHPKVFARKDDFGAKWLFGATGKSKISQVLKFVLELPKKKAPKGKNLQAFLVTHFLPQLRNAFEKSKSLKSEKGLEEFEGSLLVGVNGRIFTIYSDFCLSEHRGNFAAVGSGENEAHGSLHTTRKFGLEPRKRLLLALEAAESHQCGVQRPFTIIST